MPRDAVAWLCVVGDKGISWTHLVRDPDFPHPDRVVGKAGKLIRIIMDQGEWTSPRYGHQN